MAVDTGTRLHGYLRWTKGGQIDYVGNALFMECVIECLAPQLPLTWPGGAPQRPSGALQTTSGHYHGEVAWKRGAKELIMTSPTECKWNGLKKIGFY